MSDAALYREIADEYVAKVVERYGAPRVKLRKPRKGTRKRYYAIARKYSDGSVVIEIPKSATLGNLYSLLHEVGHVLLGHLEDAPPITTAEYEAEDYAISHLRSEGIRLPDSIIRTAKIDVANHVIDAMKSKDDYIDKRAVRFSWDLLPRAAQEDLQEWGLA